MTQTTNWPQRGYSGPQPWDLEAFGIERRDVEKGEAEAPLVFSQPRPILASGSGGQDVADLCRFLEELGYPTGLARGENPFLMLGPDELAAVRAFRRDYGVEEDPSAFLEGESEAAKHVGPVTWEALVRAVEDDPVEIPDVEGRGDEEAAAAQARDDWIFELNVKRDAEGLDEDESEELNRLERERNAAV